MINYQALSFEKKMQPSAAISPLLFTQFLQSPAEFFVIIRLCLIPKGVSTYPNKLTCPSLTKPKAAHDKYGGFFPCLGL